MGERYKVEGSDVLDTENGDVAPFTSGEFAWAACRGLNAGSSSRGIYGWAPTEYWDTSDDLGCDKPSAPEPPVSVVHEHVFRDPDWGLGMFDDTVPYVTATGGQVWVMIGTDAVSFKKDDPELTPGEARAIAAMLVAAADCVDGRCSDDPPSTE